MSLTHLFFNICGYFEALEAYPSPAPPEQQAVQHSADPLLGIGKIAPYALPSLCTRLQREDHSTL